MGLLDTIRSTFGITKNADPINPWLSGALDWSQTVAGVPVNGATAVQQSTVLACVQILAADVARTPIQIFKKFGDGNKKLAKDHILYRLFKNPNDYMTMYEFFELIMYSLLLEGNAFAVILRNAAGAPIALIPIWAERVAIYESPDGGIFYHVTRQGLHEVALLRDLPQRIPSDDIIHWKWLPSVNSLFGSSRVYLARQAIGLALSMEEHAARIFGNGAKPSMVITSEKTIGANLEERQRFLASLVKAHAGPQRSGGMMLLEGGMKADPWQFTSVDAQFLEQRRFCVEEISRIFQVPVHKLSIVEATPGSSLLQLDQQYVSSTLGAWYDRIVARLIKTFEIDDDEYSIEFDYESILKADLVSRTNSLRVGVLSGLFSINEARASLGMPPTPGGDVVLQPSNMVPLGTTPDQIGSGGSGRGPGSDATGKPASGGDGDSASNPDDEAPST
jgi:HK97 family phage portal protein